ncbi:MAG: 3-phosphoshikimate 1-carboxyvinyltransferase [Syntrophobacteraceae bacterium]
MAKVSREIQPVSTVAGKVRIPGSKSITHRALLMAALAGGESTILNPLIAEDTLLTAGALEQLGVEIIRSGDQLTVKPPARRWRSPAQPIMLGNSGTSMRLLPPLAATGEGTFVFDGTERLRERPIGPVVDALGQLGTECVYRGSPGFPPVEIRGRGLKGGEVLVDARQSSQFLSALLIAAPLAGQEMRIRWLEPVASYPYVALTLAMMEQMSIRMDRPESSQVVIRAPQVYPPMHYEVEGDCSSASYFWAAAAIMGGTVTTFPVHADSHQGDRLLLDVLESMGCSIRWEGNGVQVTGPAALRSITLDMNRIPDMVPTLAVVAAFAEGTTRITNVAHLRIKESDRLRAVAEELSKFGVPVEELEDGLVIEGGRVGAPSGPIDAHDDHRIAMAFALMGLRVFGVVIDGSESVGKSFPSFWELFESICRA